MAASRTRTEPSQLLEASRAHMASLPETARAQFRLVHVSTDEVYGSLGDDGRFDEHSPYDPRSPYSATKAASDHLAAAWRHTFGIPTLITNCGNNYGPFQFPEKFIPTLIIRALKGQDSSEAGLYEKSANGATAEQPILDREDGVQHSPRDWSADGSMLIFARQGQNGRWNLWGLPRTGDRKPFPYRNGKRLTPGRREPCSVGKALFLAISPGKAPNPLLPVMAA